MRGSLVFCVLKSEGEGRRRSASAAAPNAAPNVPVPYSRGTCKQLHASDVTLQHRQHTRRNAPSHT
jgi:hypothetical protein